MPDKLHPVVEHLIHSGKYVCRPNVEIFFDHVLKDRNGKVAREVTKEELEKIADVNNAKVQMGALTPVGAGHTFDDEFDKNGQLLRKFPEDQQPSPFGYYVRYSVSRNPHTEKWGLYADEYVQKQIRDPQGRMVDGLEYTSTFPRRSAEVYFGESWIDWVAALRRAPKLDLPLNIYAKSNPDHSFYAKTRDGNDAAVCVMGRGKYRYSFDTGGDMADNPTVPPTAGNAASAEAATAPSASSNDKGVMGEETIDPMHAEAAEQYARHVFGMPGEHLKKLMGHMKAKYGAECGINGDMGGPAAGGSPPAAEYGMGTAGMSGTSVAPSMPRTPHMEHGKMQHDQENIEKARYEREVASLRAEVNAIKQTAAAAQESELHARYERELMQLVYEGYEGVEAAKELEYVTKRKYSREQFNDHVQLLRRLPKAPIGELPILAPEGRAFHSPSAAPGNPNDPNSPAFDMMKCQRYMRMTGCDWNEAKERYNKPLNGVAK